MIRFTFGSRPVCAIQMVIPFTLDGVAYESGDWIVVMDRRHGYTDRQFHLYFGRAIDERRSA